jgi:hypothetical protein
MRDPSNKLVAWMDGELPENESAEIARHVQSCPECRDCLAAIKQASGAFNAYCDVAVEQAESSTLAGPSPNTREAFCWMPVACGIGAIAAAAVLIALVLQPSHQVANTPPNVPAKSPSLHAVQRSNSVVATNNTGSLIVAATTQRHSRPEARTKNTLKAVQQRQPRAVELENAPAFAAQPPIEISVPAEDMFPPGAVPDGISYNAVVIFAADGASQHFADAPVNGLKTGFNRGGNRP